MAMPREQLTLDEFLKIPEREPPFEFEDGRILQKVSPKGKHSPYPSSSCSAAISAKPFWLAQ